MKILDCEEIVKAMLHRKAVYRDDYRKLISAVWWHQIGNDKQMTALQLLNKLTNKEIHHPESIMRARRKIQEKYPELRGETYKERKTTEQQSVQIELGYNQKPKQ